MYFNRAKVTEMSLNGFAGKYKTWWKWSFLRREKKYKVYEVVGKYSDKIFLNIFQTNFKGKAFSTYEPIFLHVAVGLLRKCFIISIYFIIFSIYFSEFP